MTSLICALICLGQIPDGSVIEISLASQFIDKVVILKTL